MLKRLGGESMSSEKDLAHLRRSGQNDSREDRSAGGLKLTMAPKMTLHYAKSRLGEGWSACTSDMFNANPLVTVEEVQRWAQLWKRWKFPSLTGSRRRKPESGTLRKLTELVV